MGIKCSLLGHSFSETSVEEEREEQGSEVVITIKEIETCERCGKSRVVSENKEVTAIESTEPRDPEPEPEPEPTTETSADGPAAGTPAPDIDAAEDDAELLDEGASDTDPAPEPEPDTGVTDTQGTETDETAETGPIETATASTGTETDDVDEHGTVSQADTPEDDAVILDDEDEADDREPGEWPEEDRGEAQSVDEEWPEETLAEESTVRDEEPAEWPEEDRGGEDEWTPTENLTEQIDGAEIEPAGSATVTVPEGDFECPECGFRTSVESTSLRAGDFCPECHRGALEHTAEAETRKE